MLPLLLFSIIFKIKREFQKVKNSECTNRCVAPLRK